MRSCARIGALLLVVGMLATACGAGNTGPVGGGLDVSRAAGLEWTLSELSGQTIVDSVVVTDDGFIAYLCVHGRDAWSSSDGITWTREALSGEFDPDPSLLCNAKVARGRFFAVGGDGGDEQLWTSDDGFNWQGRDVDLEMPSLGVFAGIGCCDLVVGEENLLFVGQMDRQGPPDEHRPVMWASVDGVDWDLIPDDESFVPVDAYVRDVQHIGGIYVAQGHTTGPNGGETAWGSVDGRSWASLADGFGAVADDVAAIVPWGDRGLAAVGTSRGITMLESADGRSWEELPGSSSLTHPSDGELEFFRMEAGDFGIAVLTGSLNPERDAEVQYLPTLWLSKDGADWVAVDMEEAFGTVDEPEHIVIGAESVIVLWPLGGEGVLAEFGNPPSLMWIGRWTS